MIQGSPEWHEARRGKITASKFGVVINGTVNAWNSYIEELRFGWKSSFTAAATDHGWKHEKQAITNYEIVHVVDVVAVGFIVHPRFENVGGSPDGLVDDDGMVEVKCPFNQGVHAETLAKGMPIEHVPQVQGNLWVTDRKWCDFISYDPRETTLSRRLYVQRIPRDERYIRKLESKVIKFREVLAAGRYAVESDFGINPIEDEIPQLF